MSHNQVNIKEGAFIISDAHYSSLRPELLSFIQDIHSQKLQPTQLILMGDIFDALFGSITYTEEQNKEMRQLLDDISKKIEVIYLEGNHDFNLKDVFKNIQIFPISQQPLKATYNGKKIYLSHGDFDGAFGYKIYTKLIRNRVVLSVLKVIDNITNHLILKSVDKHLGNKNDCNEFENFEEFIVKRLSLKYQCDYFIEGHFHQNRSFQVDDFLYINLAAFACNQRYFIVKSSKDQELLEENIFSKGM
jgi:UDP-2,3-diacylglucosamine hydrolase